MSRLYDTIEPSVIDEQMLKNAVEKQGPKGEAGRIAKQEGIDFADVISLRLDFKSRFEMPFKKLHCLETCLYCYDFTLTPTFLCFFTKIF